MKKRLLSVTTAALMVSACNSTPPTQAEREFANEMRRTMLSKLQQAGPGALLGQTNLTNQQAQPQPAPEPTLTEAEILTRKHFIDESGSPAIFYRVKDGIKINGKMFYDPEGSVANFGGDRLTGSLTYAIENYNNAFTLKYHRAGSTAAPLKIATVTRNAGQFTVKTTTGRTFRGDSVIPTSDGFIVGRPGSAFRYVIGAEQPRSITLLENYHIAKYQNGDAAATGYILLEKNARNENDKVGGLLDSFESLGNTFGLNQVDHYVLVNLDTDKVVPMDVNLKGKNVAEHSNCRRQNAAINKCENVEFKEALYDKLGLPNSSHYFWAINWVTTDAGPMAIYKTSTKVKVIDINKSEVHTVFSRALGVNSFSVTEHLDGKISLKAKLGFSEDKIDDLLGFIQSNTADIEPMQTLGS